MVGHRYFTFFSWLFKDKWISLCSRHVLYWYLFNILSFRNELVYLYYSLVEFDKVRMPFSFQVQVSCIKTKQNSLRLAAKNLSFGERGTESSPFILPIPFLFPWMPPNPLNTFSILRFWHWIPCMQFKKKFNDNLGYSKVNPIEPGRCTVSF